MKLDPLRFFVNNKALDFSLCALADARQVAQREAIPLRRNNYSFNTPIIMIGHPSGLPKVEVHGEIMYDDDDDGFFYHTANSIGGSSGSPIFNENYTLIGIHHSWDGDETNLHSRDVRGMGRGTPVVDIVDYLDRVGEYRKGKRMDHGTKVGG